MTGTDGDAIAGLSIRDGTTANGAQLTAGVTNSAGIVLRYRTTAGGTNNQATLGSVSAPTWLRLRRSGNSVSVYNSSTGATGSWTQVGSTQTIALPTTSFVGFATCSGNATINKVVYDNVNLWTGQTLEDVGSTGATGTVSYNASIATFSVEGAGTGIGSTQASDQYAYVGMPISGYRTQVTTYISAQENTNADAFAGPMIRYAVGWADPHIQALGVTISNGAKFIWGYLE